MEGASIKGGIAISCGVSDHCTCAASASQGAALVHQEMRNYTSGANLGGWLVMENWLFPNVLLLRLGEQGIVDNQEHDYIARMLSRGIDAVGSMHAHWNTFLGGDLLNDAEPPPRLVELAAAGVTSVRIPVGYWALQEPVSSRGRPPSAAAYEQPYEQPGLTEEGFVTGATVYLRAAIRWLRVLGVEAVIDVHSLPGGAVANMGYTGRYFQHAEFFNGADAWASDGDSASRPPGSHPYLRDGVQAILRLASLIADLEREETTRGVVRGLSPWNEALFADNAAAATLMPPFIIKLTPQLRALLPADRYELYLNFFNEGLDWAAWLSDHSPALGDAIIADLHIYHAFDPPFDPARPLDAAGCPMCTSGSEGMRSFLCKACGYDHIGLHERARAHSSSLELTRAHSSLPLARRACVASACAPTPLSRPWRAVWLHRPDGKSIAKYTSRGLRVVVSEWSVGTCGMWGNHPETLTDPDFLYAFFASTRSTFVANGAEVRPLPMPCRPASHLSPSCTPLPSPRPGASRPVAHALRCSASSDHHSQPHLWPPQPAHLS